MLDLGRNASANGLIEYRSDRFGGALRGKLIIVRYSVGDDLLIVEQTPDGTFARSGLKVVGFDNFVDPLDLTENTATGDLYVAEFGRGGRITLLRPLDDTDTVARAP